MQSSFILLLKLCSYHSYTYHSNVPDCSLYVEMVVTLLPLYPFVPLGEVLYPPLCLNWWPFPKRQLEFHACRMKHIDGNWRSYELRWWLLLDDRSERRCLVESCDVLRAVCYYGSNTSHQNPHGFCLNVPLWDVWELNPLVPCGVCLHAHRGCSVNYNQ